ncbi:MAG: hypothetical protein D6720_10280, partial [Gammaproteobacteria bacterium]
ASWTLVGQRARIAPNVGMHIMSVDENCQPWRTPCGAYARGFALVLGPSAEEGGILHLVGERVPTEVHLDLVQFDEDAHQLARPQLRARPDGHWVIRTDPKATRLRVNLSVGEKQWVAEFPLVDLTGRPLAGPLLRHSS